jgi:hypothetical protein
MEPGTPRIQVYRDTATLQYSAFSLKVKFIFTHNCKLLRLRSPPLEVPLISISFYFNPITGTPAIERRIILKVGLMR